MIKSYRTFYTGIVLFIIPFLGIPTDWKFGCVIIVAVSMMFVSMDVSLKEKISHRTLSVGKKNKERTTSIPEKPNKSLRPRRSKVSQGSPDSPLTSNDVEQHQQKDSISY